jgi:protein TonB
MKKTVLWSVFFFCIFKSTRAQFWGDSTNIVRPLFYSAEVNATFPGGLKSYYHFLADNLHVPSGRIAKFPNRIVIIRIIIDTMGTVVFAGVQNNVDENFGKEALKMVKAMPPWLPAKQNGRAVSMSMSLPILFME